MIKKSLSILGFALIALVASESIVFAKPPQQSMTRQFGRVKAELSSVKVVNNDGSQGWSNFDGLAYVDLRLKISRNGKTKFIGTHEISYRDGDLARNFKIVDLDRDKEPEVFLETVSQLSSRGNAYIYVYRYQKQTDKYHLKELSCGDGCGYDLKDLDKNGIPEFVSYDSRFAYALGGCASCVAFPIRIFQYRQGKMLEVTRRYPKAIRADAYQIWQRYQQQRQQGNDGKGELLGYLASKYLLNESEDGWKRVKQAYQGSDRNSFFRELMSELRSKGYVRTASNAAK